jgi:hypothetical protein
MGTTASASFFSAELFERESDHNFDILDPSTLESESDAKT